MGHVQSLSRAAAPVAVFLALPVCANAAMMQSVSVSGPSGLSAEATFTIVNPTTLEVRLKNTSTGSPGWFTSANNILTGVSWDFGLAGIGHPGEVTITGGTVVIGPSSFSVNFDTGSYGPGTNVGGEWGYSNVDGTGMLWNFISSNNAQVSPIGGGANLDGPISIDGPQAGLVSAYAATQIGGLGAIQDEIIATLTLSSALADLDFLDINGVRFEWGSDALFLDVPAPGAAFLLATPLVLGRRRRD